MLTSSSSSASSYHPPIEDITTCLNECNAILAHGIIGSRSFANASSSSAAQFRKADFQQIKENVTDSRHELICKASGLQIALESDILYYRWYLPCNVDYRSLRPVLGTLLEDETLEAIHTQVITFLPTAHAAATSCVDASADRKLARAIVMEALGCFCKDIEFVYALARARDGEFAQNEYVLVWDYPAWERDDPELDEDGLEMDEWREPLPDYERVQAEELLWET